MLYCLDNGYVWVWIPVIEAMKLLEAMKPQYIYINVRKHRKTYGKDVIAFDSTLCVAGALIGW